MKILGIDPSLRHTGIVLLDSSAKILFAGLLFDSERKKKARLAGPAVTLPVVDMYKELDFHLREIKRDFDPDGIAIERFMMRWNKYGHFIEINKLIGWIEHAAYVNDMFAIEIVPTAIKKHICGNGRATKKEVKDGVIKKIGKELWKGSDAEHLYDAYATAYTAFQIIST